MRPLTNLELLNAALIIISYLVLNIVLQPVDYSAEMQFMIFILAFAISTFLTFIFDKIQRKFISKNSKYNMWHKNASVKTGAIFINIIVCVWLIAVGVIALVFMIASAELVLMPIMIVIVLVASGFYGRYLQKRFSSNTLLAYGLSYLGALTVITLISFIASVWMGSK